MASAWEDLTVCWAGYSECAVNWQAVEAVGTILAFGAVLLLPLWIRYDDRRQEVVRARREGQGLALCILPAMIQWIRAQERLRQGDGGDLPLFAHSTASLFIPKEVANRIANVGLLGPAADNLIAAVNATHLLTARHAWLSKGIRGEFHAEKNFNATKIARKSLDDLYRKTEQAHADIMALCAETPVRRVSFRTLVAMTTKARIRNGEGVVE